MAAGLPIVASGVGGILELIEDGRTGWLVPPGQDAPLADRVIHVMANPAEGLRFGAAPERTRSRDSRSTGWSPVSIISTPPSWPGMAWRLPVVLNWRFPDMCGIAGIVSVEGLDQHAACAPCACATSSHIADRTRRGCIATRTPPSLIAG
jgi:hypothetical protein